MQNQSHLSAETSSTLPYSVLYSVTEWETVQNEVIHAKVEDYLDRVCQPLIETAPYATRMELRREIAQHLASLAQAYQEMGDDAVLATDKALEKFGEPEKVARQWKPLVTSKRHKPTLRRWFGKQWQGIASTLTVCSVIGVLFAMSRPMVSPTSLQISPQSAATMQEGHTTMSASNFHHNQTFNTPCTSCHASTAQINTSRWTFPSTPPRVVAPR